MKICFVYKEDYPWDVRVEKIVNLLADNGHEVTLLARNNHRRPRFEELGRVRIHRLPALPVALGRINQMVGMPAYFNPVWLWAIISTLLRTRAEALIVRDLPLMPASIVAGRLLGLPVVFDMAECYPEMYASILEYAPRKSATWLFKNPTFAAAMERFSIRNAARVIVMIEESRDRLLRMGVPGAKILIGSNTPSPIDSPPRKHANNGRLKLFYVGFVTRIRGLDNALEGIATYKRTFPDGPEIEFDIVGKGAARQELEALATRLGIADCVHFHGWQEKEVVDELYRASDVGVLTYHVCGHWNHTIPNKLFDYMRSGIPVLATDVVPIRRIVEDVGCGLIFRDCDAAGCANALAALGDPDLRNTMGSRGHAAVRERYNWEVDGTRILELFADLAPRETTSPPSA